MDVYPLRGEPAIEEVLPADGFLSEEEWFVDGREIHMGDGRIRPMLDAEKKETGGVG